MALREGNFMIHPDGNINKAHPLPEDDKTYKVTYPVAEYDHDEGKANCRWSMNTLAILRKS
jgi:hypothetical protein